MNKDTELHKWHKYKQAKVTIKLFHMFEKVVGKIENFKEVEDIFKNTQAWISREKIMMYEMAEWGKQQIRQHTRKTLTCIHSHRHYHKWKRWRSTPKKHQWVRNNFKRTNIYVIIKYIQFKSLRYMR